MRAGPPCRASRREAASSVATLTRRLLTTNASCVRCLAPACRAPGGEAEAREDLLKGPQTRMVA